MRFCGNWTNAFSLPNVSLHFSSVRWKSHFRQIWPRSQGSLSSAQSGLLYLAGRGKLPEFSIPSNSKPKRLNLNSWWVWLGDLGFPSSPQPLPTHSWLYPRSHSPRILRLNHLYLISLLSSDLGKQAGLQLGSSSQSSGSFCPECRGGPEEKFPKHSPKEWVLFEKCLGKFKPKGTHEDSSAKKSPPGVRKKPQRLTSKKKSLPEFNWTRLVSMFAP